MIAGRVDPYRTPAIRERSRRLRRGFRLPGLILDMVVKTIFAVLVAAVVFIAIKTLVEDKPNHSDPHVMPKYLQHSLQ